jgi:agmatine/peptidylarginine deiminase
MRKVIVNWDTDGYTLEECGLEEVVEIPNGIEEDEIAQKYIHEAFPNCTINQIEMTKIAQKGGALHCISWNIKQTPNS